ncbi:MAG: hypothetical protein H0V44_01975 [Planctomycetes bacterium]|nr:hypothetical protein [Planctomycetota bacterium]
MIVAIVLAVVLLGLFIAAFPLAWHFWIKVVLVPAFLFAVLAAVERQWQQQEQLHLANTVEGDPAGEEGEDG